MQARYLLLLWPLLLGGGPVAADDIFHDGVVDEIRIGLFDHDSAALGSTSHETGPAIGVELLLAPLELARFGAPASGTLVVEGRAAFGASIAPDIPGTDIAYAGVTVRATYDDRYFAGLFFGLAGTNGNAGFDHKIALEDGLIADERGYEKFLGSRIFLREALEIGVRFGEARRNSVSLSVSHISHAEWLSDDTRNSGMDLIGLRFGRRL